MSAFESGCQLFSARNGMYAAEEAQVLFGAPEITLSPEEREAAFSFAKGLFEGQVVLGASELIRPEFPGGERLTLEQIDQVNVLPHVSKFYLGYFETEKGRKDLLKLGIDSDVGSEELPGRLCEIEAINQRAEAATRKEVATASLKWFAAEAADQLLKDPATGREFTEGVTISVNYRPEKLVSKLENLQAYRRFYRQIRGVLREADPSPLGEAQRTLLNIHAAKVNAMIASLYPAAIELIEQISQGESSPETQLWRDRLNAALPVVRFVFTENKVISAHRDSLQSFSRKLDLLRNGAARDTAGNDTPLSSQLKALAERYRDPVLGSSMELPEPVRKHIKEATYNAEQMKALFELVLEEWGMLSEHQAEYADALNREGTAPDNKWQVVIDPNRDSHETSSSRRVIFVPADFERTLGAVSRAGALPVAAHELTHALQAEYDDQLGAVLPLAKIKGRRALTIRELGTIHQERLLHAMLGQARPTQFIYERALAAKESGGSIVQVARAYLEGKPDISKKSVRMTAVRNSLRLYRKGGHDSQPLDYSEQELISQALQDRSEDEFRSLTIAGSSFSLAQSVELRRAGLLSEPPYVPQKPAETVIKVFLERLLPEELRQHSTGH